MSPGKTGGAGLLALALVVLAAATAPASAAGYPDKPISLVEPYPAGSISDIGARVLAQELSTELGQPVRVVDAPGAHTAVGASKAQSARADGYTLFWDIVSQLAYVIASKELPYTAQDFQGVALIGGESLAVIARTDDKRFASVKDMVSYAKAHPGALSIAGGGPGISQKAFDDLTEAARIKAKSIPYSGGSKILAALLGGHVDLGITAPSNATTNDKLRVLMALTAVKSYSPMPGVETAGGAGYNIDAPLLRAIFVKKGTPAATVSKLSAAVQKALNSPKWHEFSKRFSQIESSGGADAANASLQQQAASWTRYLKNAK